jgi:hypothetical protein
MHFELKREEMAEALKSHGRAMALMGQAAAELGSAIRLAVEVEGSLGGEERSACEPRYIPCCTDCRVPAGGQHKPSCHRQGAVTSDSAYLGEMAQHVPANSCSPCPLPRRFRVRIEIDEEGGNMIRPIALSTYLVEGVGLTAADVSELSRPTLPTGASIVPIDGVCG